MNRQEIKDIEIARELLNQIQKGESTPKEKLVCIQEAISLSEKYISQKGMKTRVKTLYLYKKMLMQQIAA